MPSTTTRSKRTTQAKPAEKVRPIDKLADRKRTKDSVSVEMKLTRMPNGTGGVGFEQVEAKPKVVGRIYIEQPTFALLGKPETLTLTLSR